MTTLDNLRHWEFLRKVDPEHTKKFDRGRFKGTAVKPIWIIKRMTELFGPVGEGWGTTEPQYTTCSGESRELLVYCTVGVWHATNGKRSEIFYGVGGDKVTTHIKANEQYNRPERWENNDEAFKAAYTDAISNALKLLGVAADVHMGLFDDHKYVREMEKEFAGEPAQGAAAPPPSAAAKPNGHAAPARKAPAPTPGKGFDLLFPNGDVMQKFGDPDEWCHGLRMALEQKDSQVAALWQVNKPVAEVIRDHYPGVLWADRKGTKFPAHDFLEAIVRKLLPGIPA